MKIKQKPDSNQSGKKEQTKQATLGQFLVMFSYERIIKKKKL